MGDDNGCAIVGMLVVAVAVCLLMAGFTIGQRVVRTEAIERHHAKWVADENGSVQFVWIESGSE